MEMQDLIYTVTLEECHVSKTHKDDAIRKYVAALETLLGGTAGMVAAKQAFDIVFSRYEDVPLPPEATQAEREAVSRWDEADIAATNTAFEGWFPFPQASYFSFNVRPAS